MKTNKKIYLIIFLVFFFQLFSSEVVRAAEYPDKPIKFLVGYVPGSVADLGARIIAKVASKHLDKPLVVVNMPGASSTVSLNELAKSPPDGHTIAWMASTYKSLTVHQQKIPFDPKILKPLLGYAEFRFVLFVQGGSPYARLEDFIAYGQKNPGAIKYGHSGKGATNHLTGMLFFRSANINAIDVPYQGTAEFIQAVIGGHIMAGVLDVSGIKQHVSAGTLKPVVALVRQRLKELPEVPTPQEKGYADVSSLNTIICVTIHRDTSLDRVTKLHDALKKTVEDPDFVKMMDEIGQKSGYISPGNLEEAISKSEKAGVPLLKELGLFVE